MEVISFDGYSTQEKLAIAKGYLWPRQVERNGLLGKEVKISDKLLEGIITDYTREAGVRSYERELGRLLRKLATKILSKELTPPIKITAEIIIDALGQPKFHSEVAARTAVAGVTPDSPLPEPVETFFYRVHRYGRAGKTDPNRPTRRCHERERTDRSVICTISR